MQITQTALDEIRREAEKSYPNECCGVLLGRYMNADNRVTELFPADNLHQEDHSRRYLITPDAYRAAEAYARDHGLDVVGVYHSHPDHPPRPSETDLEQATFPGFTYIIASVTDGETETVTAWDLAYDRSRFVEDPITVQQTA